MAIDWSTWGPILGTAAVGAAGGYLSSQQQNDNAQAAGQPRPYSSQQTPYGSPYVDFGMQQALQLFDNRWGGGDGTGPGNGMPAPPQFGGGGGGRPTQLQGPSAQQQQIADDIYAQAQDGSFVQGAQGAASNLFNGGSHPMMQQAMDAASSVAGGGGNQNLQSLFNYGMGGGFLGGSPGLMGEYIQGLRGEGSPGGSAPRPSSGPAAGGAPNLAHKPAQRPTAMPYADTNVYARDQGNASRGDSMAAAAAARGRSRARGMQPAAPQQGGGRLAAPGGNAPGPQGNWTDFAGGDQYRNALVEGELAEVINGRYLEEGNPYLQQRIDDLQGDMENAYNQRRGQLDAQMEGAGRFGGGLYRAMQGSAFGDYMDEFGSQANEMRYQNYGDERDRMMQALGLGNQRDASIWGDQTQRHGIDTQAATSRANASASAGAARYAADQQYQGLQDQLELQAINSMAQNQLGAMGLMSGLVGQDVGLQQGGIGMMGQLGMGAQQAQLGALGMVPGLEQAGYMGLGTALGAQQGIDQQQMGADQFNIQAQQQAQQAAQQNAWRDYQAQMQQWQAPVQGLDQYIDQIRGLSSLGGSTSGMQPGQYVPQSDPWAGAMQGALGGGLSAWGAQGQGGG